MTELGNYMINLCEDYLNSPNIDYRQFSYEKRDDTFSKFELGLEKILDNYKLLSEEELDVCQNIIEACGYFVPDPTLRADSDSYFDEDELKRRIRLSLQELARLG